MHFRNYTQRKVKVSADTVTLDGEMIIPSTATGIVLFAHGSGSSRHSPRNKFVARRLRDLNLATLLFDLLTPEEEAVDVRTRHLRFDISLLSRRLVAAVNWLKNLEETKRLKIGLFGSSTGAGAALVAAAELGEIVGAVVSRGGRPDLAGGALTRVKSAVLMIVGGRDDVVIRLNGQAYEELSCEREIRIVPGATHLFEEPGTLESVADMAGEWFARHLK